MPNCAKRGLVGLHQRERRGRDVFGRINNGLYQAAGEVSLAGSDLALKQQHIAGRKPGSELFGQTSGIV